MRDWLIIATNYAVTVIDWLALIMIVVGAVEAFFRGSWTMFALPDGHESPVDALGGATSLKRTSSARRWPACRLARASASASALPPRLGFGSIPGSKSPGTGTWPSAALGRDLRRV